MEKKLINLLNEETIQVKEYIKDWEEAIKIATEPLLLKELVEKKYIEAMINAVNTYGPYMVLADYFALMHARPEDGVNETSLSILISKNPVDMKGKKVKIFLILAAKDNNSHIEYLSEITKILSDENNFNKFIEGNKKEIIKIIEGGE